MAQLTLDDIANRGFNTTLVLLREWVQGAGEFGEFLFQHHSGAIEGRSCRPSRPWPKMFQHHSGAIEGVEVGQEQIQLDLFQHHSGAIEGQVQALIVGVEVCVSTPLWCY